MKSNVMPLYKFPVLSTGKQDILREVVIKYIDHFYPNASGTSAVAIDNKIEQAMDLVKSHLMFAVREEVEVLKEKIAELMDRINQLELENTILKANASQDTLVQLTSMVSSASNAAQQQQQQPPPQPASAAATSAPVVAPVAAAAAATPAGNNPANGPVA